MDSIEELLDFLGDRFRGLWTSVILFDSHGGVTREKEWTVTYELYGDFVETPGYDTPIEALQFAAKMIKEHGPTKAQRR